MGNAYRIPGARDRLRKQQQQIRDIQANLRNRDTPRPVATTATSGISAAGSTGGGTGNFLSTEGGTMIGPLALNPPVDFTVDIDANNTIDISPSSTSEQYSSNIQIEDVPTSSTLDIIQGAAFDGQLLIIRTFAPPTITISQGTLGNGGNIQTPDGSDVTIGDLQIVILVYDDSLIIEANTGGTWRLINTFGGASGGPFLPTAGGTMLGPIGYDPDVVSVDSDGRVAITSSYMQSTGIGTPDDVFFFDGALFNGQQLEYQVANQTIQVIKNAVLKNITNIVGNGVDNIITVTIDDTSLLISGDKVNISDTTNFNLNNTTITVTGGTTFTYNLGSVGSATPEGSGTVQRGNIVMPDDADLTLNSAISTLGAAIGNFVFDPTILGTGWRLISSTLSGGAGSGDVTGPASSTNNAITRYEGTTGKIIQNSGIIVSDNNDLTNIDRLQISGGTASATSVNDVVWYLDSVGNLVSNVNALDGWIWSSGNITKMILTDSTLEKRNVTAPAFQLYNTRTAQVGTAGSINFLANSTDISIGIPMSFLISDTEAIAGDGRGSLKLGVNLDGTPTLFLTMNEGNDEQLDILKETDFNAQDVLGINRLQLVGGTTSATSVNDVVWYLDSAGDLVSNINATDGWIWNSGNVTKMILTDDTLEKRNVTAPVFQLYNTRTAQVGTAGTITILANTANTSTGVTMGFIIADTEVSTTDGSGSLKLGVNLSGIPTNLITLNNSDNGLIDFFTDLDMNTTNSILNMGGETINSITADVTPDGATDFVMTYDASTATLKKVLLDNLPSGGGDVTGPGSSTDNAIARFDGITGKIIQNSLITILDSGTMNFNNESIANLDALGFNDIGGQINVSDTIAGFNFVTTSDRPFRFTPNSTDVLDIDDGGLTMISGNIALGNGNVTGVNQIAFNVTGQTITDDVNGMRFSLPDTLDTYDFTIDSNVNLSIEKFFINFFNSRIQMNDEVDPASPPAGDIFVYAKLDSGISKLFYKQSNGTVIGPLGAGGANTALSNLTATSINVALRPFVDAGANLGSSTLRWATTFTDTLDIQDDQGSFNPSGGVTSIRADVGGMNFGLPTTNDTYDFFFGGANPLFRIEEDRIEFVADSHTIRTSSIGLQLVVSALNDEVEFFTGSARSNATVIIEDERTTWRSSTTDTRAVTFQIIQNNNTPLNFRTLGNLDFIAENSISADTIYARISSSSQDITDTTEDGLLQLGVVSGGTLIASIDMEGNSAGGSLIGFFGVTPVAQQVISAGNTAAKVAALEAGLIALGLFV